jgi:fluoride exporter
MVDNLLGILMIALAGTAGTLARFWLSRLVQQWAGTAFPWGTFAVNIIGSFLFGLVWSLATERRLLDERTRIIILTGFMGAFTTFSTFAFETTLYLRDSQWGLALVNILAQVIIGVLALFVGMAAARLL